MKKLLEIYEIENGYLIKRNNLYKSYQWGEGNNQELHLLNEIIKFMDMQKKYKAITVEDAARMMIRLKDK